MKVSVYHEGGDLVAKFEESLGAGSQKLPLDLQNFAPGVYLYRVLLRYDGGEETAQGWKKFAVLP